MSIFAGANNEAVSIPTIYAGVGNEAKSVKKVYAGVNGVAKLLYTDTRLFIYNHGDLCSDISGGWTKALSYQTDGGVTYSVQTKMTNNGGYLTGTMSSSNSQECLLYARTGPIDMTNYDNIVFKIGWTTTNLTSTNSLHTIKYGILGTSYTTLSTSNIPSRMPVYSELSVVKNKSDWLDTVYSLNISAISGSYNVVIFKAQPNLKGTYSLRLEYCYLV